MTAQIRGLETLLDSDLGGLAGARLVDCAHQAGALECFSSDPQVHLARHGFNRGGWYRLTLQGSSPQERSQIYFDLGAGFNERESVHLNRAGAQADAIVFLPGSARAVRFDPAQQAGRFSFSTLSAKRLGRLDVTRLFVLRTLKILLADPGRLRLRARQLSAGELTATFIVLSPTVRPAAQGYAGWIKTHEAQHIRQYMPAPPTVREHLKFSLLMPTFNPNPAHLRAAIRSVIAQTHRDWELCIADDASTDPRVRAILRRMAASEPRLKLTFRAKNGHISHATNSALDIARGDFVICLDQDDLLREFALEAVANTIANLPSLALIYSDEDKIDAFGRRFDPNFKPGFSLTMLRSQNYLNHLTALRTDIVRSLGGWRPGFEGSQDYDLYLRFIERIRSDQIAHIPMILYHWRAVKGSTAASSLNKAYAFSAGLRALNDHLKRVNVPAIAEPVPAYPFYRLHFAVPEARPKVSIVIPTRDQADLLRRAVTTALEKASYENVEVIIVDNGSTCAETARAFLELSRDHRVRIVAFPGPFNFSAINNYAVQRATGELLIFLNDDTEALTESWLREAVGWICYPEHGCVGGKLIYPSGRIQHAGVALGAGGVANHLHLNVPRESPGFMGRLVCAQDVSAVTAAFLGIRRNLFELEGGFDAHNLPVAFNDVDLCLRVASSGLRNVFVPNLEFTHYESASRGSDLDETQKARFAAEVNYMQIRWVDQLNSDPYYNPAFDPSRSDFCLPSA